MKEENKNIIQKSFSIKHRHSIIKNNFNINSKRSILQLLILLIFFTAINSENNQNYSIIYMKVKSTGGDVRILYLCDLDRRKWDPFRPNEIYVNDNLIEYFDGYEDCDYLYDEFEEDENNVTIVWYEPLNNLVGLFYECVEISEIISHNFDTSKVINMASMFYNCYSITSLDISGFNTINVENMAEMFSECTSLKYLNISNFDTSKVTNMESMFCNCQSLTSLDVSNFNTVNVTKMGQMFSACASLTSLDLSHFNTGNVTEMNAMFSECSSLKYLDVSSFDTHNVNNFGGMFEGCSSLTSLNISHFILSEDIISEMFYKCPNLISLYLSNINTLIISSLFSVVSTNLIIIINDTNFISEDLFQCEPYLCCLDYYNYTVNDYNNYNYIQKCISKIRYTMSICETCGYNYEIIDINKNSNYTYCVDKNGKFINVEPTLSEIQYETNQITIDSTQLIEDTSQLVIQSTQLKDDTTQLIVDSTQLIPESTQLISKSSQLSIDTTQLIDDTALNLSEIINEKLIF